MCGCDAVCLLCNSLCKIVCPETKNSRWHRGARSDRLPRPATLCFLLHSCDTLTDPSRSS